MKITDRFIGDHKTFRKLMADIDSIEDTADAAQRRRLVRLTELFVDHLLLHAWGEDTFYYPAVAKAAGPGKPITESYMRLLDEEHKTIDAALKAVETLIKQTPASTAWKDRYAEFKAGLSAHMKKEEEQLFPLSEKLLGAPALEKISSDLEKRRNEAPPIRRHASF